MPKQSDKIGPTALAALLEELGLELRKTGNNRDNLGWRAETLLCNRLNMWHAWPHNDWRVIERQHPQQEIGAENRKAGGGPNAQQQPREHPQQQLCGECHCKIGS